MVFAAPRTRLVLATLAAVVLCLGAAVAVAAGGDGPSPPRAGDDEVALGVVPQRGDFSENDSVLMAAGGVESVRFWLPWSGVEAKRDKYEWGAVDHIVKTIAAEEMTLLPYLFGSPEWAAHRDGFECSGFECIPYPPRSIETRYGFARFAAAAVARYGPEGSFWDDHPALPYRPIADWQVWNEQNSEQFYRPDADVDAYAALLKTTAREIYAADPGARVVLGGMFGKRSTARLVKTTRYLRDLYRVPGIEASFDGVAVHPYDPRANGVLASTRAVRRVVRAYDDGADLWITEIGWASSGSREQNLVKTPIEQARLLRRSYAKLLSHAGEWGLRGVYWYAWRDTAAAEAVCGWCAGAGLVSVDGLLKPAYRELRALTGN